MTSSRFLRQGALHAILHDGFWKSDHVFLIAFYSNFFSVMHGFRYNEVLLRAGYDDMVIFPPRSASHYFTWRILKGRPRIYIHVQLTLFVYLERFRRYSTFFIWLGFPYWGRTCGGFGAKWPPKRKIREKHLLGEHFLTPNCVVWAIVREIISIRLAYAGAIENKSRHEGRKSQEVYISRMCGATPAGGMQPNLAHVFFSRTLSNVITW